jgi:hypothetical protein
VAVAVLAAVALLAPAGYLFSRVWSSSTDTRDFNRAERRGVAYLGPLTELLSVVTEAQSTAVRGEKVDVGPVRAAVAEVDEVDGRLGAELGTTERWTAIRQTVVDRTARDWSDRAAAYVQYSDLVTTLMELTRKVGDVSNLILDPQLDAYYVMNATLLRIPEILVDSGRYTDLSVLAVRRSRTDGVSVAQLTTARNRVATNATDLADGLVKAFASTGSETLGPGLTRQLDDFRTAVDAVAPSNSMLAPAPERTESNLAADQDQLQRAALALQEAGLAELDRLLAVREDAATRTRVLSLLAAALVAAVTVAAVVAVGLLPDGARSAVRDPDDDPLRTGEPSHRGTPELISAGPRGGARAG